MPIVEVEKANNMKRSFGAVKRYGAQALGERVTTGWRDQAEERSRDGGDPLTAKKDPKPDPKPKPPPPQPRDTVGSRIPGSNGSLGA